MTLPAYCITMRSTPQRHKRAETLFDRLGLPVTFHVADRDPQGSLYGCWRSHIACWLKGQEAGYDVIAVFEDDVEIPSREELLRLLEEGKKALDENPRMGLVLLHNKGVPTGNEVGPVQVGVGITLVAYLVHLPRMLGKASLEPTGKHLDYELLVHEKSPLYSRPGVFVLPPSITAGSDFGTENDYGPIINGLFKLFGYASFVEGLSIYVEIGRRIPRWLHPIAKPLNEFVTKLLQPQ